MASFVEVGNALMQIRDAKLYVLSHKTFEDYCRAKWGMSYPYADRLISAASTVTVLSTSPMGEVPKSERQVRPLTKLKDPEQQREAWNVAVEVSNGKPTAKKTKITVAVNYCYGKYLA